MRTYCPYNEQYDSYVPTLTYLLTCEAYVPRISTYECKNELTNFWILGALVQLVDRLTKFQYFKISMDALADLHVCTYGVRYLFHDMHNGRGDYFIAGKSI